MPNSKEPTSAKLDKIIATLKELLSSLKAFNEASVARQKEWRKKDN